MDLGTLCSATYFTSAVTGLCLGYFLGLMFNRKSLKVKTVKNFERKQNTQKPISNAKPTCTLALVVNSSLKMGKGKVAAQVRWIVGRVRRKGVANLKVRNVIQKRFTVQDGSNSYPKFKQVRQDTFFMCGHAILSVVKKARKNSKEIADQWMEDGQDVLLVYVKSDDDFDNLAQIASVELVNHYVVADAGRTQIESGSLTVMAIGPSHCDKINSIVGQLPLYL